MSLVSEALGSSRFRIVLGVIAAWAGFQLWLTLAAPGKISLELGGTSEKVNVQVDLPFTRAIHCHCSRCRKHSGAFGLTVGHIPRDQFRLLEGEELIRVYDPGGALKAFCVQCGSSLFGGQWPEGDRISVRLGALDGDPQVRPERHSYVDSRAPWDELPNDGLPRYPDAPPADG